LDDLLGIGPREVQEFDDADGFVSRERDQVDRRRHIVMSSSHFLSPIPLTSSATPALYW